MKRLISIGIVCAFIAGMLLIGRGVSAVAQLREQNPTTTPFMRSCSRPVVQQWVALDRIAPILRRAVIEAEDPRFFAHHGLDGVLIANSILANIRAGRVVRGASSITMQTAKNIFLGPKRTWMRKWNEVWLALAMETMLSKERILEMYLNVAEFAPRIYGAELGARYHVGTSASGLNIVQAAKLASLLPNPKMITHPKYRARFARAERRIRERLLWSE